MGTKRNTIIMLILMSLVYVTLIHANVGKDSPPVRTMDDDYIPSNVIVNISEDTWMTTGSGLDEEDCDDAWGGTPCPNGEESCSHNCPAYDGMCGGNVGDDKLWVHENGGTGTGSCGSFNDNKETVLWFNMSEGRTAQGNFFQIPWYLIYNATVKIYADSGSISSSGGVDLYSVNYENNEDRNPKNIIQGMCKNKLFYDTGTDWSTNSSWWGSLIKSKAITGTPKWVEWNVTNYTINQTTNSYDVMLILSALHAGHDQVSFIAQEHSTTSQHPYMVIQLDQAVCGDGYCTPVNETEENCCIDCGDCVATNVSLYLNGTQASRMYINSSYANFTVDINVTGLEINLTTDMPGWTDQSGSAPLTNITQITCTNDNTWYNITGYYEGNTSYVSDSETLWAVCYFGSTLDLYINGTDGDREFPNGTYANFTVVSSESDWINLTTNMTGWTDQTGSSLLENISLILCNVDTVYNITAWGSFTGNSTHLKSLETHYVTCTSKRATNVSLYLNNTQANYYYLNGSYANFTAEINMTGLEVNLTTNITGWTDQSSSTSIENISQITCNNNNTWYNITGHWKGNDSYSADSETLYAICYLEPSNITLTLNSTQGNYYYLNGTYANFTVDLDSASTVNLTTNITGWIDQNNTAPLQNTSQITCSSNNTWYNITGYWGGNSTHFPSSETHYAICYLESSDITLTLNSTQGNYYYLNKSYANFTVNLNVGGTVNLTTNITGWTDQTGSSPLENTSQITCSSNNTYYNVTGHWKGNDSYSADSETLYAICYLESSNITLTLNSTQGNYYYLNGTYANFTVDLNVGGTVNLTTNISGWADQSGSAPLTDETQIVCSQNNTWYNITGWFTGNSTHLPSSETHYTICYLEPTTLNLYINGTDDDKEYINGTYANFTIVLNENGIVNLTTNMTGWVDQGGSSPLENISLISCNSDTVYNITGWFTGNSTYLPSSETHYLSCSPQKSTNVSLYLNNTQANYYYSNSSYANLTVNINITGLVVNLTTNISGWVDQTDSAPLTNITQITCSQNNTWYNITGYYEGNASYAADSETFYSICYETTTTTVPTTTAPSGNGGEGGGGGGGGGGGVTTTTTTIPVTTIQVTNMTTTTVITTTTLQITTTSLFKIPLKIGELSNIWIILIVAMILGVVILITFIILRRKTSEEFYEDVYDFNEEI